MKNTFLILLASLQFFSIAAVAEEKKAEEVKNEQKQNDTDISDLADEYWRPSKDELEVIQNRRFDKKGRFEVSATYGFYQGGDWLDYKSAGVALTYNWNNQFATEISYLKLHATNSELLNSVRTQFAFTPNFNQENSQLSAAMLWTPIYAKFGFLGKKISHFETYLGPGIGLTKTAEQHLTKHLVIGEKFFITEHFIFQIAWKMSWYTDKVTVSQGTYAIVNGGPGYISPNVTRHNLLFGFGWMF